MLESQEVRGKESFCQIDMWYDIVDFRTSPLDDKAMFFLLITLLKYFRSHSFICESRMLIFKIDYISDSLI